MTNHESLAQITGQEEPVEIEAVKMLLSQILDDHLRGTFNENYDKYLSLYKGMVEWLNSEVER